MQRLLNVFSFRQIFYKRFIIYLKAPVKNNAVDGPLKNSVQTYQCTSAILYKAEMNLTVQEDAVRDS